MLLYGLLVPLTSSEASSCRSIPSTRSFGMCSASLKMTAMTSSMRWRTEMSWASLQHNQQARHARRHALLIHTTQYMTTPPQHITATCYPLLTPNATNEDPPYPPTYSSTLTSLLQRRSGRVWTGPLLLHCLSTQGRC